MFKRIVLMVLLFGLLVLLLICVPALPTFAEEPRDIVITQDMLMKMGDTSRNALFLELKKHTPEVTLEETITSMSSVNIANFKENALAVADALNIFCEKIGVTVNEFITTPAGNFIIFGALYKLGVFSSIWGFLKGTLCIIVLLWLLISLNTRKVYLLKEFDRNSIEVTSREVLVPKLTAIFSNDGDKRSIYAIVGSIICMILLFITVAALL